VRAPESSHGNHALEIFFDYPQPNRISFDNDPLVRDNSQA